MFLVDTFYIAMLTQAGLGTMEGIERRFMAPPSITPARSEIRLQQIEVPGCEPLDVFFKLYRYVPPSWRFIACESKAHREYQNYATFRKLGIPTADRIACGEWRDSLGRLRAAFIITRAIPNVLSLPEFWRKHCASKSAQSARDLPQQLRHILANLVRTIHDADFYHHDLVWRNVLVSWNPPGEPRFWWIDCPRGRFDRRSPWRWRRRIRDLALLDKLAPRWCTRTQRAAFVMEYLQRDSLDTEVRRVIRAVLKYSRKHWPATRRQDRSGEAVP
jgi:hypothetical protein